MRNGVLPVASRSWRLRRRAARALGVAVAAALVLAGVSSCGIPSDERAHRVSPEQVPVEIPSVPNPVTTSTTLPEPSREVELYFVRGELLAAETRVMSGDVSLGEIVGGLSDGPQSSRLRTALTPDSVASVVQQRNVTIVDLTPAFAETADPDEILALGQIVLTITALPIIDRVRFTLEGAPLRVPDADGVLVSGPVSAADYRALTRGG